jgi:signal peptidase I
MMTLFNAVMAFSFPAILLVLTVFTGAMWLLDRFKFAPKRQQAAQAAVAQFEASSQHMDAADKTANIEALRQTNLRMPWWLEYTAGFFTVILAVFVLRSFVAEPFRIPSASMMPTLQNGDLILVNKFAWGLRMPVYNNTLIETGKPDRGDVIVFRFPLNESQDYIKRVIGLPGDTLVYDKKVLSINGKMIPVKDKPDYLDENGEASGDKMNYVKRATATLPLGSQSQGASQVGSKSHDLFVTPGRSPILVGARMHSHAQACQYLPEGIQCTVPAGHYFVMGDNRDNSLDSRYWGFVPERNIVGKAFFIWMNLDGKMSRLGGFE